MKKRYLDKIVFVLGILSLFTILFSFIRTDKNEIVFTGLDILFSRKVSSDYFVTNIQIEFNFIYIIIFILILFASIISLLEDRLSKIISLIMFILSIILIATIPNTIFIKSIIGNSQLLKESLGCNLTYGAIILIIIVSICVILNGYLLFKLLKKSHRKTRKI